MVPKILGGTFVVLLLLLFFAIWQETKALHAATHILVSIKQIDDVLLQTEQVSKQLHDGFAKIDMELKETERLIEERQREADREQFNAEMQKDLQDARDAVKRLKH